MPKFINPFTDVGFKRIFGQEINKDFSMTNLPHKLRTDIVLADRDTHELFSDKMRYIFIELPLFTKEEDGCETGFERWVYVLKNMVYRDQLAVMEYERLQGEARGEARGRANVARCMKADGMPVETIACYTGLTPEGIEQL